MACNGVGMASNLGSIENQGSIERPGWIENLRPISSVAPGSTSKPGPRSGFSPPALPGTPSCPGLSRHRHPASNPRSGPRPGIPAIRLLIVFVFAPAFLWIDPVLAAPTASPATTTTTTLPPRRALSSQYEAAKKELTGIKDAQQLGQRLDALSSRLEPDEAFELLAVFTPLAPAVSRSALYEKAGRLALLLGRFSEAGRAFVSAAGSGTTPKDLGLLLRAGRCLAAAGDTERARQTVATYRQRLASSTSQAERAKADILEAWSWLIEGKTARAEALVLPHSGLHAPTGSVPSPSGERREALFLLWLASAGQRRNDAASMLSTDFATSPEAALVQGRMQPPPLAHWMLSILPAAPLQPATTSSDALPAGTGSTIRTAPPSSSPPVSTSAGAGSPSPKSERLQAGVFSREENARKLSTELSSRGFQASVEMRKTLDGLQRWAVTVELLEVPIATSDAPAAKQPTLTALEYTRIRLKELGYESYPVEY